jgi:hypothetical protein
MLLNDDRVDGARNFGKYIAHNLRQSYIFWQTGFPLVGVGDDAGKREKNMA